MIAMSEIWHGTAELFDDAVARDGLPDHQGQILRGKKGQVNESEGDGDSSSGWLA
jgi:hypothetical protein